jgi:cell division protein FtsL
MEPFEYAIKKDVRNNPIVREVDRTRHRELWEWVAVGGVLVIVLLFWTWQHFQLLQHGYEIGKVQTERATEEERRRQLRLEYETLRSPKRIEGLAANTLHLVTPTDQDAVIVERVQPSEPPAQTVVARR